MSDKLGHPLEELLNESFKAYDCLLKVAKVANSQLQRELEELESAREDARNRRQETGEQSESAEEKANQLMNMLSSVLRTMAQMRQLGVAWYYL